jgi:hypothetical protein
MKRPTCKTCPFWARPASHSAINEREDIGECRFNAPKVTKIRQIGWGKIGWGIFPATMEDDWCSKHPQFSPEEDKYEEDE